MKKTPYTVVVFLKALPGKEDELRAALIELVAPSLKDKGCLQYDLHESLDNPGKFMFYENWESKEDHQLHFNMPHVQALGSRLHELGEGELNVTFWEQAK